MDDTSQRIVDAAMGLIRDKGYVATTTKDIAKQAVKFHYILIIQPEMYNDIG